jgi:hypothetical protein
MALNSKESTIPTSASPLSPSVDMKPWDSSGQSEARTCADNRSARTGALIINADDWGRDHETTEKTFQCIRAGTVSSVSAMIFMEDSERAAAVAREARIDAGLHLNFTTPFSSPHCPAQVVERQHELVGYLLRHSFARVIFHPGLVRSFEYVVKAQLDEFAQLYGARPDRIDGHHHMHLCANVLLGRLLPPGTLVRRNFSFQPGEKSLANRLYRKSVDRGLARRHRLVDYLFSLTPLESHARLERIRILARQFVVEVETHPINADEYHFLTAGGAARWADEIPIAPCFSGPTRDRAGVLGGQL